MLIKWAPCIKAKLEYEIVINSSGTVFWCVMVNDSVIIAGHAPSPQEAEKLAEGHAVTASLAIAAAFK